MSEKKTHRLVKNPAMSAKELADYMVASELARRTIVRDCKFRPIARITQHNEAKSVVAKFIRSGSGDTSAMLGAAENLRSRMADTDFDRDLFDHNADYIERFAQVQHDIEFPDAERMPAGPSNPIVAHGVRVNPDIQFRFKRITRTNKVRVGAGVLRYAKGKSTNVEAALWQAAFVFGYIGDTSEDMAEAEHKLCITIDAHAGLAYPAPGDAIRRYANMRAACASIAERWPAIPAPPNAVL